MSSKQLLTDQGTNVMTFFKVITLLTNIKCVQFHTSSSCSINLEIKYENKTLKLAINAGVDINVSLGAAVHNTWT